MIFSWKVENTLGNYIKLLCLTDELVDVLLMDYLYSKTCCPQILIALATSNRTIATHFRFV